MYIALANTITAFHTIFILAVFAGILVSVRYKRFRPIESLIILSAVIIWSLYGGCPLTFIEDVMRANAGYPIPLREMGFIPYYADQWFNLSITAYQLTVATYITALVFFLISIEWLNPYVNFEIVQIRKYLRRHTIW